MRRLLLTFISVLILLNFISCKKSDEEQAPLLEERALVEVEDSSLMKNKFLDVSGRWEYYKDEMLNASMFYLNEPLPENKIVPKPDKIVSFPHYWKNSQGCATYHLRVTGLKPLCAYSIYMYDKYATAGDLFCNGKFVFSAGHCDSDWKKTIAGKKMSIATFSSDVNGTVDLVLHSSNKDYRMGGIFYSIKIAEESHVAWWFYFIFTVRIIFIGALFIIIIYQLALFFMNGYKKTFLFLALLCFFIMLRIMIVTFSVILLFWPSFPYSVIIKLEYLTVVLSTLFYFLYMLSYDSITFKNSFSLCLISIGIVLCCLIVFTNVYFANRLVPLMQVYLFTGSSYGIILTFAKHEDGKRHVNVLDLIGILCLFISVLHDVLMYYDFKISNSDTEWIIYGTILFTIIQCVNTAFLQYVLSVKIKKASLEMEMSNNSAYRFVPQGFLELIGKKDISSVRPNDNCKRRIAIINTDICGFTSISEHLDGAKVFRMLNIYMDYVTPIIRYYGGFVEKVMGDGIIAVFSEGSDKALLCALEMQEAMVLLQSYLTKESLPTVEIGVGVHYGDVVLGTVGNEKRLSEVIISPVVDEVMAIQSYNRVCHASVLASEECVKNISEKSILAATEVVQPEDKKCKGYSRKIYSIEKSVKY